MASNTVLPWSSSAAENKRFNKITLLVFALTLLSALWIQIADIPDVTRVERQKLPPQLARLIRAKPPVPINQPKPKPKVVEQPKPIAKKPAPVVKPKVKPVVKKKAEPVGKAKPKPTEVVIPKPDPNAEVAKAKIKAKQSGLLAFQDDLANMRKDISLNNLAKTDSIKGGGQQAKTERKRIGRVVAGGSGGVSAGNLSTNVGARGELTGRRTTEFVAPSQGLASLAAKEIERDNQVIGDRDLEDIRKIISDHKGAIYSLYRRALRKNPELEGKVTVQLVIEPDGSVSAGKILDSELNDSALERRLLGRIQLINFGVQKVTQTQLDYGFNFLPF
jgi:outer membrane biosynthesis protein TonB